MDDRDHFAAAALTGIVRTLPAGSIYYSDVVARQAYGLADDMLRERAKMNLDAAPAARAQADSDRTDKAVLRPGEGTGDKPVTNPLPKEKPAEVSDHPYSRTDEKRGDSPTIRDTTQPRNGTPAEGSEPREGTEPVAWAVVSDSTHEIDCEFIYPDAATAGDVALEFNGGVVPLYRQPSPTLTDAEREAVRVARDAYADDDGNAECEEIAAVLTGLLERMGGWR